MDKSMISQVNPHTTALGIRVHSWGIDLRFAHALPSRWVSFDDLARIRCGLMYARGLDGVRRLILRARRKPMPYLCQIGRR